MIVLFILIMKIMTNNAKTNEPIMMFESLIEMSNGPLAGKQLCIGYDKTVEKDSKFNMFIQTIATDVIIFNINDVDLMTDESMSSYQIKPYVQKSSLFILVLGNQPLAELSKFDGYWFYETIIVVITNEELDVSDILKLELIQKFRDILVLKEFKGRDGSVSIKMFTAQPFPLEMENPEVFLGSWNKTLFGSFQTIFPDRFKNFKGKVLHMSSDTDDFPYLIRDEDTNHTYGVNFDTMDSLGVYGSIL